MKRILKSLSSLEKLSIKISEKLLSSTKVETQVKLAKVVLPHYYQNQKPIKGRYY